MLKLICKEIVNDNYKLINEQGEYLWIDKIQLKKLIKNKYIQVLNLKLTLNNRLILDKPIYLDRKHISNLVDTEKKNISFKVWVDVKALKEQTKKCKHIKIKKIDNRLYTLTTDTDIIIFTDLGELKLQSDSSDLFSFLYCNTLDLTNVNTAEVTTMNGLFKGSRVANLNLESIDTQKVKNMSYMFYNSSIYNLKLGNFDTSQVTSMAAMFYNSEINNIDFSTFNTSNVITMAGMFYNCNTDILNLITFDTSKVIDMSHMFSMCKVNKVNLSTFTINSLQNLSNMFTQSNIGELIGFNSNIAN